MAEVDPTTTNGKISCDALATEAAQLRLARANLLEAISMKLTNLFTTIIANCDMATLGLDPADPAFSYVAAAKQAAYEANDANGRVRAVIKECREANQ